ncbi:hypothetical protein NDU88_000075 [Pleurodeles waltl]|uniref:Ig-like domain-containing protein n=1 Tax=Pleurodeles waltl TaxID=8319 RepID=A0AAV7V822_PLEWA|nr:hypothetical protein NDU88_000075 [Pleurodeles waltl]
MWVLQVRSRAHSISHLDGAATQHHEPTGIDSSPSVPPATATPPSNRYWRSPDKCLSNPMKGAETSNQVLQPLGLEVTEGETAEVTCKHSITSPDYLAWYQHRPGGFPRLLFSGYSSPPDIGRLSMFITKDRVSTTLKIRRAGVRDAAVYYCGVRDTVREERGNLSKKRC